MAPPRERRVQRLERLAWILDNSIKLPFTRFRFGIDGLVGLFPGVGDLLGAAISSYVVAEGVRFGAPATVMARMGLNVVLEILLGVVPIFGDLFDFGFKANSRNVRLLRDYCDTPEEVGERSRLMIVLLLIALGFMVFMSAVGAAVLLWWLWSRVFGGS